MDVMKRIAKILSESCFCYAKSDGQGFVNKVDCPCFHSGIKDCEAIKEKDYFHQQYDLLAKSNPNLNGNEIVGIIAKEFEGKETHWFHQNVKNY